MTNNSWDKNSWAKTYRHDRWDKQRKTWNTFSGDKTEGQVQFSEFFNYNPLISKPAHKPNQCRVWSHNCTVVTVHTVRGGGGDVGSFHRGHGLSRILHGLTSSVFLTKRHYFQLSKFILGWTRRNNNKKRFFFDFMIDFSWSLESGLLALAQPQFVSSGWPWETMQPIPF